MSVPAAPPDLDHFATLNAGIKSFSVGRHRIEVGDFKSPEPSFRARVASPTAVARLATSFADTSSVHEQCMVVGFWPSGERIPEESAFAGDLALLRKASEDGFFFIVGDHTQQAVSSLHRRYPRNRLWSSVLAEVLVCHRSQRNLALLKSWGILDNIKGQVRTKVSFFDKVMSLHEDFVQVTSSVRGSRKVVTAAIRDLKRHRQLEYRLNGNTFGQLWGLASREGKVWERMARILQGQVANPKKFKAPRSASAFTMMGNIPEDDLCSLLDEVIAGGSLRDFYKSCKVYKAKARVQREILTHPTINGSNWLAAQEEWPNSCSDAFVQMWGNTIVTQGIGARKPLPRQFLEMLQVRLELDQKVAASALASASVSLPC